MEADGCREGIEGVSEPCVELVRRRGEGGRGDAKVLDGVFSKRTMLIRVICRNRYGLGFSKLLT